MAQDVKDKFDQKIGLVRDCAQRACLFLYFLQTIKTMILSPEERQERRIVVQMMGIADKVVIDADMEMYVHIIKNVDMNIYSFVSK